MGPAVIENHAANVLRTVRPGFPADAALREYLSKRMSLGSLGKREVSRAVFASYRWISWIDPKAPLPRQVAEAMALQARFDRNPASFKTEALLARAVPSWLASEFEPSAAFLRHLQSDPALWIRTKLQQSAAVASELGECEAPVLPASLVLAANMGCWRYRGLKDLHRTDGFTLGAYEIQDLASQLVGHACSPSAGQTWWDACAGEGGKTLHLGDLMQNKGLVWATDRSERRLAQLKRRTSRAGMFNYRSAPWSGERTAPFRTLCDGVLVDAPCSGVGTWQRNPHARWTTLLADVHELAGIQSRLLDLASRSVKPGGRLVYAVCTLTRSETIAVAERFDSEHPQFTPDPLPVSSAGLTRMFFMPEEIRANGMFVASWRRSR